MIKAILRSLVGGNRKRTNSVDEGHGKDEHVRTETGAMKSVSDPDYIADLILRMNSAEVLPQSGPFKSSKDTVKFQAYREAERLADVAVLPQIAAQITARKKLKSVESRNLAKILSELIRNTDDTTAVGLYLELIERSPTTGPPTMYLISGARKARIRECREFVVDQLGTNYDPVLSEAIQYFGAIGDESDIPIVGDLLDADCNGVTHPMYCAMALQEIGHKDALPYLTRAVSRHQESRKQEGIDTRYFSEKAIEAITGASR
jgi:hypothetical protein